MNSGTCAACSRTIDTAAKLCPYCGADPVTAERVDTQAILQEIFHPRELSTSESVLEFARQRQGIVVAVSILVGFLILAGLHQFATMRNATAVTDAPAVPLSEIIDVTQQTSTAAPKPMPELDFPYEGRPQTMRTFILEPGAMAPAPAAPAGGVTATAPNAPAAAGAQPRPAPNAPAPGPIPPARPR